MTEKKRLPPKEYWKPHFDNFFDLVSGGQFFVEGQRVSIEVAADALDNLINSQISYFKQIQSSLLSASENHPSVEIAGAIFERSENARLIAQNLEVLLENSAGFFVGNGNGVDNDNALPILTVSEANALNVLMANTTFDQLITNPQNILILQEGFVAGADILGLPEDIVLPNMTTEQVLAQLRITYADIRQIELPRLQEESFWENKRTEYVDTSRLQTHRLYPETYQSC